MATLIPFTPRSGSEVEWNAAYYRLEDYFRALRLLNKLHQSQVILRILEAAAESHEQDPSQNPTELAMQIARDWVEQWFEGIFGKRERLNIVGLISMLAIDAPERWPRAFPTDSIPPEMRQELQESDVKVGPEMMMSSMTPRPVDFGPLLEPVALPEALGKVGRRLGIAAVAIILTVLSIYLIFLFNKSGGWR